MLHGAKASSHASIVSDSMSDFLSTLPTEDVFTLHQASTWLLLLEDRSCLWTSKHLFNGKISGKHLPL
jgi:hypothetical protein